MPRSAASSDTTMAHCDGQTLKHLTKSGLVWLEINYEKVNALNVFPVPDGDTGTNMLLTMRSAWKEIANSDEIHAGQVAQLVYNGALMGARGNSGVILSQLWRGFARAIESDALLTGDALVRGFQEAVRTAYQAVQSPVEGTILTVAREASEEMAEVIKAGLSLHDALEKVIQRCHNSVNRTPELLPVLKEAGVVDSGGMGLTFILEGMLRYLNGETLELSSSTTISAKAQEGSIDLSGLDFPYDVQFLIMGDNLNLHEITETITAMGDSALVVGDQRLIKVHVHVTNPGVPLGFGAEVGKITDVVVENMALQYEEFVGQDRPAPAPSFPTPSIEAGTIAIVTIAPGDGLIQIFYSLGAGKVISGGQTMNPSTEEIVSAITSLPTDKIVILPNNKNILLAAKQAMELTKGKQVAVIPTTTIPQGIAALFAFDPYGEFDTVVSAMGVASALVETGEITTATRNVTMDGLQVKKGNVIGLHNDILCVAGTDMADVAVNLLNEMNCNNKDLVTLYYGAEVTLKDAESLTQHLRDIFPEQDFQLQSGGQSHYYYIMSAE